MQLGLYHRFNKTIKETIIKSDGTSEAIIEDVNKENPYDFEKFVARIVSEVWKSETFVTRSSGDEGVDIEEIRNGKKISVASKVLRLN